MIPKSKYTEKLIGRISNWKFQEAREALHALPKPEQMKILQSDRDLIGALAASVANCGWFDGNIGIIIGVAVDKLIGPEEIDRPYEPDAPRVSEEVRKQRLEDHIKRVIGLSPKDGE